MKVLLLHQHFRTPYTGGAIRSYYLARALVVQGIKVVLITAFSEKRYRSEVVDGIEVHYLPIQYKNSFGFYKRSIAFLKFVWASLKLSSRFKDCDACYAMSVPLTVGIAARLIRRRYAIPYYFEVGDLWPEAPIQMGIVRNAALKRSLFALERWVYREAEALVALSPPIRDALRQKAHGKKIHLIPNIADTDFFTPGDRRVSLADLPDMEGKFVVSYTGAIGLANGLEYLLEAARACADAGVAVHFVLCGDGAQLPRIRAKVDQLEMHNLSILPHRDRNGVRDILSISDAAVISFKPVPVLETGSPNKYFDGLAAGKLIVVNFGGWIRNEVEQEACGVYADPLKPAEFAEKLLPFVNDPALLRQYQQNARRLAERKYARNILGPAFVRLFNGPPY